MKSILPRLSTRSIGKKRPVPAERPCNDLDRDPLWRQIWEYDLDPPGTTKTFARRLAAENRWAKPFADRVVEEYRCFAFLAARTDQDLTPSQAVDRAWHLHLQDTRRYWEEFCPDILGRPLHHEPGRGVPGEEARHRAQYARTRETYTRVLGEPPPPDIWPNPEARASGWVRRLATTFRRCAPALLGLPAVGCVGEGAGSLILVGLLYWWMIRALGSSGSSAGCGGGCSG